MVSVLSVVQTVGSAMSWTAKTLETAEANRKHIESISSGIRRLLRRDARIVITGVHFVGKTVLFDWLSGKTGVHYKNPGPSGGEEHGKLISPNRGIKYIVLPGQEGAFRNDALDRVFRSREFLDCWIHVVSNGYTKPHDETACRLLVRDFGVDTIEKLRKVRMEEELENLRQTADVVRRAVRCRRRHRGTPPLRAIVAATKADLWADKAEEAADYYSPHADTPFAEMLRTLQRQMGEDFFQWTALPVCSTLDAFVWNSVSVGCKLSQPDHNRRAMINNMLEQIETVVKATLQ